MRRQIEHGLQKAVAHMLTISLDPEYTWWSAIDHGAGKLSRASAGSMKARGVKAGMPDFIILAHHPNTFLGPLMFGIEMKAPHGRFSDAQHEVGADWLRMGFKIYAAHSLEEVNDILLQLAVPLRRPMTFLGGDHERPGRLASFGHSRSRGRRQSKNHMSLVQRRAAQEK